MKPEKILEQQVLLLASKAGFWLHIYEAKAVFSESAGCYLNSQLPKGHSDLAGICPNGLPCYIELKAPRKLNTLRSQQRTFLTSAISRGAFAIALDDPQNLIPYYQTWNNYDDVGKRLYLLSLLPPEKK